MIHPDTELRLIGPEIGYGVFATAPIPAGTIVYVKDDLELAISPSAYRRHRGELRAVIEKYSYIDERGDRIVSWDFAKYVNHSCDANTISTGYGFEFALRDIAAGEEVTDEYGLFNLKADMPCSCGASGCRRLVRPGDFETYCDLWDARIRATLPAMFAVPQPLADLLDRGTRTALARVRTAGSAYRSVWALRYWSEVQGATRTSNLR